jgi:hypothetical protein
MKRSMQKKPKHRLLPSELYDLLGISEKRKDSTQMGTECRSGNLLPTQ